MDSSSKQWRSLGDAASPEEAEALSAVRALLPDNAVTHAWANLSFLDLDGRTAEVDLLLLSTVGLFVVELKGWHGTIGGDQQNWRVTAPNGNVRHARNPLFATDLKAKRLRSLLEHAAPNPKAARAVPFIGALVVLHGRGSTVTLPETARAGLFALDGYGVKGSLPTLSSFLDTPPPHPAHRIDGPRAREILTAIQRAGFTATPKNRYLGQYPLEKADPLDAGPSWQDLLATHPGAPSVKVRLRVFDVPPGSSAERRQEVELAARREFVFTRGIAHPGIACPLELVQTDSAPALVFEYDDAEQPLGRYLADAGAGLDLLARLDLIRQTADALRYAHQRRLVHRALAPSRVYVNAGATPPRVVIRDWQTGRRTAGTATSTSRPAPTATSFGTADVRSLVGQQDWVYLAPEAHRGAEDLPAVPLDVYGLGALAHLVLTGEPPAQGIAELQQRLERHGCLDPRDVAPSTPDELAEVVRAATQRMESERLGSIDEFLRLLAVAEEELTAPPVDAPLEDRPRAFDPLTAGQGDAIGDRFIVLERRGTGSTGTALLVEDYDRDGQHAILKIAKDDAAARRLVQEAEVLAGLAHSRLVRLVDGPIEVDGRTAVLLSDAGRDTLAGWLEAKGRATLSELERFGTDLLEAVAYLDSQGVFHRDIKPANLGIQPDPATRRPRLVLFDLSLAREPLENTSSGTRGYTDPFLGASGAGSRARRRYDRAAELYGVAATLFEMATTQLPWWRDGELAPASREDRAVLAAEMFESAVAKPLTGFFARALAPDAADRFGDVEAMAHAWHAVFASVDKPGEDADDAAVRDAAANAATLDTPLDQSGLSARALSALARLQARTVGELIRTSPMAINSVPGLGEQHRKEVQRRVRAWRARLIPTGGTTSQDAPPGDDRSVETTLNRLLPQVGKAGDTEVAVLRLLVGMPLGATAETPPDEDWWPSASDLADKVGVTRARVSQILDAAAQRWHRSQAGRTVLAEVVAAIEAEQGVATVPEVASAVLLAHGSLATGGTRLRRAAGLVRVAVEADARSASPRLAVRRPRGEAPVLLATAEGSDALDDVQRLARAVDRLLDAQAVVPASVAREALQAVSRTGPDLTDDRLLRVAAAASGTARLSALHELYRPTLDLAAATETALRGVSVPSLAEEGVRRRVASRFPGLAELPRRPALDALVEHALPGMCWDGTRYTRPTHGLTSAVSSSVATRTMAEPRDVVDAALRSSLAHRSALTLCTRPSRYARAATALADIYGVRVVDVAAELVAATRGLAERDGVDWSVAVSADVDPSGPDWANLRDLVHDAFAEPWAAVMASEDPLLLVHLAPLARYGLGQLLSAVVDQAQPRPAARWLLVPRKGSAAVPTLDGHPVPLGPDRWIELPDPSALRPEVPA